VTESDNGMIFKPLPEVQEPCQCWLMDTVPIVVAALNVLLVEDSPILTQLLAEVLRQIPTVNLVDTVETEAAALAVLKREIVDVLVLDLHLKVG
jgi:response regulator RpfG family c-di-GMP phosphodiesterase